MPHNDEFEPMKHAVPTNEFDNFSVSDRDDSSPDDAEVQLQADLLGVFLSQKWAAWSAARKEKEDQWLKNIRQFRSIYEPAILNNLKSTKKSQVYLQISKKKVLESFSHQTNTFFPGSGVRHWSINATPVPEVDATVTSPEARAQLDEIIKQDTKKMSTKIEDQLVEANYPNLFRSAVLDSTIMGTGIIVSGEVGVKDGKVFPKIRHLNPFDSYPDPDASIVEAMSGHFERMVISRKEFGDLRNSPDFDAELIDMLIIQNPKGNHVKLMWEWEYDDAHNKTTDINIESIRFEVLRFDGYLNGIELKDAGFPVGDENLTLEYRSEVWISGNRVLKATFSIPEQGERLPYNIFPHLKDSNQLHGVGVPETMNDSQDMINAGARRLIDDLATSGTIFEISREHLTASSKKTANEIYNGKIYFTDNTDLAFPAVRMSKIPTMSNELMSVISMFRKFMDDETTPGPGTGFTPTGTAGATRTASGLSILKGEADIVKNTPIKNIDDYLVVPLIKSLYQFNRKWFSEEFAGGLDVKVKALGSKSLQAKEVQNAQMANLLNIANNPTDASIVKRRETYSDMVESMGMNPDERIRTEEEVAMLSQNPQQEKLDSLAVEKLVLENEKIGKEINEIEAKTLKELSAVDHDKEALRQSGIKLEAEILAGISDRQKNQDGKNSNKLSATNPDDIRRDGLKTNNREGGS